MSLKLYAIKSGFVAPAVSWLTHPFSEQYLATVFGDQPAQSPTSDLEPVVG